MPLASIPSPAHAAWRFGPVPVRAAQLCVVAGILVAVLVAERRYRRAGGRPGIILDVAAWAVPFGLIAAVLHAALTDARHDISHTDGIWPAATACAGAIGVPGAIALGAAGAWVACRRAGVRLGPVAGAAAPALAFGLAVGGLGDWWAQQGYGPPFTWWWAVDISPANRVPGYENYATFTPAFGYRSLWEVILGLAVIWAARRFALSGERAFLLCAAGYAAGSFWIELIRIGPLPRALGLPYGAVGDIAVFFLAAAGMYLTRPGRKPPARVQVSPALVEDSSGDVMSM